MIIELEVGGARVIVSGDNLSINVSSIDDHATTPRGRSEVTVAAMPNPKEIKAFRKARGLRQDQFHHFGASDFSLVHPQVSACFSTTYG